MPRPVPASGIWPNVDVSASEERVWLLWLVRLRWVAIFAQVVTLSFASRILSSPVLVFPLLGVTLMLVLGNFRAVHVLGKAEPVPTESILLQLTLDVLALTAYFALAGGTDNPFTSLYLIHIAMGAVMMRTANAAILTVLILGCYGMLGTIHLPLDLTHHSFSEATLIALGRIFSFTITTITVSVFVVGLSQTLRRRERQLLDARDKTAATDRLRALGTLAAGAAHEINTPLSTMGLRLRRIGRRHEDDDTTGDLVAIRGQLDRCAAIVQRLLVGAGDPSASEIGRFVLSELVNETVKWWTTGSGMAVDLVDNAQGGTVEVPPVAFGQALVNLLENAREAQLDADVTQPIEVSIARGEDGLEVRIRDHGVGIADDDASRVGDPFFTTKATGTGLGVFVARSVADGSGGGLRYRPHTGGTDAIWWFPEAEGVA